jgi:hypothetical protein
MSGYSCDCEVAEKECCLNPLKHLFREGDEIKILNKNNLISPLFGPEPSVFSLAVEKLKNLNIQYYNFACGSVWV